MKHLMYCLFLISLAMSAQGEESKNQVSSAPFGLSWGMSSADLRASGVKLSDLDDKKSFGVSFRASDLPKVVPDAQFIGLSFGYSDKLWRILVIGQDISNDPYGNAVKERYNELVVALSEKYGRGTPYEHQDTELWRGPEHFLMGLSTGRGWYYTNFDTRDVFVQLGIQAQDSSTAHWRIIYEYKNLRAAFEADQKAREKDAL